MYFCTNITKQNIMEEKTIDILKEDAIINIKVSYSYYCSIFALSNELIKDKTKEQIESFYALLKQGKEPTEDWQYHYRTLLTFLSEYQKQAKLQNGTEKISKEELEKRSKN